MRWLWRSPTANDTSARTVAGLVKLVERITPWLLDLGNWIFGARDRLRPPDPHRPADRSARSTPSVLVATAAIALALPPDIAGFLLLRLAADMKSVDLELLGMAVASQVIFLVAVASTCGETTWSTPAGETEPERK